MSSLRWSRWVTALVLAASIWGCSSKDRSSIQLEVAARDEAARAAALDAGSVRALGVSSRADVLFEEGFANVEYDPPDDYRNHAFRWMGQRGHVRLHAHGDRAMKLKITGWLHEKVIRAKAVVTIYLDGQRLQTTGAVEHGDWALEALVPAERLRDAKWLDLIITVSAVAYHWSEPPALRVVVVTGLSWLEAATLP